MNYPAAALRAIAGVTSVTSAVAAYPVAANLFGAVPGAVVLASSAAAIYAGWHVVATSTDTDKRVAAGVVAGLFAATMVAGIHASADLQTAASATDTAKAADALYLLQEQSRIATLADVTAELRATSKTKHTAEYADLQKQVDKLSVPTARQATAEQVTNGLFAGGWYSWAVASVFEVVTPALLLLAGMVGRRATKGNQGQPVTVAHDDEGQPEGNPMATQGQPRATQQNQPLTGEGQPQGQLGAAQGQPVEVAQIDPFDALATRQVALDDDGNVTVSALVALTGCTPKQARTAFAKAVDNGILTKTGTGGATRYRYAPQLRAVK